MGTLFACGFELQSTTNTMEWATGTNGSPAIETSIKHSGAAALRINNNAAAENILHLYRNSQGPHWCSVYFYIVTNPSSTRQFITLLNSSNTKIGIRLMAGADAGKLQLFNEEDITQIGSNSSALSTSTWYRIDISVDDTTLSSTSVEVRLYAASAETSLLWNPSGTADLTASPNRFRIGTNGADANFDVVYDDIYICDNSGSFQNTWPGEGELIIMRPDANSGTPQWARGGTDSGANWSQVEEIPPDDVTTYVESNTNNQVDEYTLEATPSAMDSTDTILWVGVGARFAISATTGSDPDFVVGLKSGSNVDESGNLSGAGSTTWATNATTDPKNYPVLANDSNYQEPGTNTAYTKSILDSLVVRIRESFTDTHLIRVSAVWVYVRHKPSSGITGTASITQASDTVSSDSDLYVKASASITQANDTLSSASAVQIKATASINQAADTIASASALQIKAASAQTQAGDTLSSTAEIDLHGAASITQADNTLASASTIQLKAAASITQSDDTLSAVGEIDLVGSSNITQAADSLSSSAALQIKANSSLIQQNDTLSAAGSGSALSPIEGTANITQADNTVSSAAQLLIHGVSSVNQDSNSIVSAAVISIKAQSNITQQNDIVSAAAKINITGAANANQSNDTLSALGDVLIVGTLNSVQDDNFTLSVIQLVLPIEGPGTVSIYKAEKMRNLKGEALQIIKAEKIKEIEYND